MRHDLVTDAEDWGEADRITVIERLVRLPGLRLIDVGCGDGGLARQLVDRGASVIGIEPDRKRAERNRAAAPVPGLEFIEAPGEALPLPDASADGVIFSYSLHHVPPDSMDLALKEAMRVLRPEESFLCVLEPMLTGSMEAVWRPFHDETIVRTRAYDALRRTASPRFPEERELRFSEPIYYDDYAAFAAEAGGIPWVAWRENPRDPEVEAAVRAAFEKGRTDRGYCFHQDVRVNFYRTLR